MSIPLAPPPISTTLTPSTRSHEVTDSISSLETNIPELLPSVPSTLESSSKSLTLDQLSLLHADVYRRTSDLDKKTDLIENAKLLQTLLKQIPLEGELKSINKKLESLIDWETQRKSIESHDKIEIKYLALALCKSIGFLQKGGCLTFNGSYSGNPLIFDIIKTNDNTFDFHIINTGEGTEYHHNDFQGLKTKIAPLFTIRDISVEELLGSHDKPKSDLFESLLTFQSGDPDLGKINAEQIYATVIGCFPEKPVSQEALSESDFITPTRSENSSWKTLMALMRQTMSKELYKKVVFLIKENTLISFIEANQELLKADSIEGRKAREIVTRSAKKLSIRTAKIAHDELHSFTPTEIQAKQELSEKILLKIDEYKKAIYTQRRAAVEPLEITEEVKPTITLPPWVPSAESASKKRIAFAAPPILDFEGLSFLENLNASQKLCFDGYSSSLRLQRQLIIDFVRKAPKPWGGKSALLKNIPMRNIREVQNKLYHYFNAYIYLAREHGFEAGIDKITLFSLYSMILHLSLRIEEEINFHSEDRLSKMFGVDLDSPDLISADNLMQSPYDRVEWESIREYFKQFTASRMIHQDSYVFEPNKNPKPAEEKAGLLYHLHRFTERQLSHLKHAQQNETRSGLFMPALNSHLDFTKALFNGCRSFNPQSGSYSGIFDKIGVGHLPILITSSLYLQHFFSGRKKIPPIQQGGFPTKKFIPGSFYDDFEIEKSYDWDRNEVIYYEGRYNIKLPNTTFWVDYTKVKQFKGPAERLDQRTLLDISDYHKAAQSQAEAALVDDPNLAIEKEQKNLAEVLEDLAIDPREQRHQIIKEEGPRAIMEAEAKVEATTSKMPYLIAHAATHNSLRPIELLALASDHLHQFQKSSVREDFLQQFFKLPLQTNKASDGTFDLIEDPNFEKAFIEFLSKYKDSTLKFSIFSFGMEIGIRLLPYVKKDSFRKAICTELEAINVAIESRKDPKELYKLHLLLALKEAITFNELSTSMHVSSPDEMAPELQKCFNSLLMNWMWIKINGQKDTEQDDKYQTLYDLIFPIFTNPITQKLIDDKAIRGLVKTITGYAIPASIPSRALGVNPIIRMFDDGNATCVDLFEGKISTKNDPVSRVEFEEVYYVDSFQKVFGDKKDFNFSLIDSWYHFSDPMKGSFRVRTRPVFLLEKKIQRDWARLQADTKQQGMQEAEWIAISAFNKQIQSHCQILTSDYFCYESSKGYYYFSKTDEKNAYFIPRDSTLSIQKINEDLEVISEIIPVTFLSERFQKLTSRFEDPSFVYLEIDKSTGSKKLIFPRYHSTSKSDTPLTFILSGDDWLLESNPSKRLCKEFPGELIYDFESFLAVENTATKQLSALIPNAQYQADFPSFAGGAKLDFTSSTESLQTQKVSYDDIPFDRDLRLQPSTPEHKLRLFYLALGQANFEIALSYLKQISPSDLKSPEQRQIGANCLEYLIKKEQTPESIALQMQLGYRLFYYEFIKGIQPQNRGTSALEKICSLYNTYCNRLGNIPVSFRLSFEEEKLILEKSPFVSSPMVARIASCPELKPSHKVFPSHSSKSAPFNLDMGLELIESPPVVDGSLTLEDLERLTQDTLADLDSTKLMDLVKTHPYIIYDIVYDARLEINQKKQLQELLHLASCLTAKSTVPEYRLLHKFLLMLNDSEGPSTLKELYRSFAANPTADSATEIELWEAMAWSYLGSLNRERNFQLPEIDLESSLYPHLKVLSPPNSRTISEGSDESASTLALPATSKATLAWTGSVPESTALTTLAEIKRQVHKDLVSFNYGLTYDSKSIRDLEETALAGSDPLLNGAFRVAFDNFREGFEHIEDDERLIPDLDTAQLMTMEKDLEKSIEETDILVKTQLEEILTLANTPSEDVVLSQVTSGLLIGGVFKKVTIEHLRLLLLSSDKEAFRKACPQLNPDAIQNLYNKLSEHLYVSINLKQMKRLREAMVSLREELRTTSVKEALAFDGTMLRPEVASKALALKMIAIQGIKGKPSPQHLLFEYTSHMFRSRPDQERLIVELSESTHRVAQVLMGGGKTTVFAANLLAKACAEGKIAIFITPNFQYESVYKTIQQTLNTVFGIEVVTFEFRKDELNLKRLEALELTLLRVKHSAANQEPKVLLLRPESLQFLTLEWLDILNQIKGEIAPSESLLIKWKTLTTILKLLKEEGYSLGDEVHVLLDIVKEIHIPIGLLHSVDQENISLVRDIFKIINNITIPINRQQKQAIEHQLSQSAETTIEFIENSDGSFAFKIDQFLKLSENKQSYCSREIYKQILLPAIATCLALGNSESLHLDAKQQASFLRYVQGDIKEDLQKRIPAEEAPDLDELDTQDLQFLKHLNKLHNSSNSKEKKAADLIALSKYILSDLFPLLLSKTGNIHFGRKGDSKTPGEVVPYIAANTPSVNKFGNHYEAIIYHFMCALMFGVEDEQIKQVFTSWDAKARELSKASFAYNEAFPSVLCKKLFGILPCQLSEGENLEKVKLLLKSDSPGFIDRLFAIEESTIGECVSYQKETISAHAHMLADICDQFQGLSGTFHLEEFFLKLQENPALDVTVNPLCIRAFLEKPAKVLLSQEISPELFISENFTKLNSNEKNQLCAILDAGGIFKDYDNKAIAKAFLQKLKTHGRTDIKAVIFFAKLPGSTNADHPVLIRANTDEVEFLNGTSIEELSSKGLKAGDYAIYLDSHHCTGTDISLPENAVGFLTYDPSIGLDTTTQAMMRFRNYLINQSFVVVVPEYSCRLLPKTDKTLQEFVRDENHLEAKKILVAQMIIKQVEQGSGKMIKSFRKMLEHTVFQKAKELLLSVNGNVEATKKIARGFKSQLLHLTEDTPYLSFGCLSTEIDTLESLRNSSSKILKELETNLKEAKFKATDIEAIIDAIEKEHRTILEKAQAIKPQFISKVMELISGKPLGTEGTEKEIAITVERQIEVQQQEVQQQVEQQVEQDVQREFKRLQLRKKQEPCELINFNPASFLAQISSESKSPAYGTIESIKNLFNAPLQEYAPLFEDSPLLITSHFRKPYKNPTHLFDASHLQARPFQYLLVCKLSDSSYRAVIVSGFEASELVAYLRTQKSADVWLASSSARLQAGDQTSWELCCQHEEVKKMMVTFNLLGGNTEYLFKNIDLYCQWYFKQDQTPSRGGVSTLKRFLQLIAVSHPLKKDMILNYLIDPATLTNRLSHLEQLKRVFAFNDLKSFVLDQSSASFLSPFQLQKLRPEQVRSIGKYLTPEQITQLTGSLIEQLPKDQLRYLSPRQVGYLTSEKKIQSLSLDLIKQLKKEDLPEGSQLLEKLMPAQYSSLQDEALIKQVPKEKLVHINPKETSKIGTNPSRLKSLIVSGASSCLHFGHLSREQLEALSKEGDAASLFQKIPRGSIKNLDLTSTTHAGCGEECNGFVACLTEDQLKELTEEQIKQIKLGKDLGKLKASKWICGNETAIREIEISAIRGLSSSELTQDLLDKFCEKQVHGLTPKQVEGLSDLNKCPFLSPDQLDRLTGAEYAKITNEALIRKIPHTKLVHIDPQMTPKIGPDASRLKSLTSVDQDLCIHFGHLSREQLEALSKDQDADSLFQKIPEEKIKNLDLTSTTYEGTPEECNGFVLYLSIDQKAQLEPSQIEKIKLGIDLRMLRPMKWKHANARAIQQLLLPDIKKIPLAELPFLLDKLSEKQIQALNLEQVRSLKDPNQCPYLTEHQVSWFTPEQVRKLTNEALLQKVTGPNLVHIQPKMTPKIGPNASSLKYLVEANKTFCDHFGYLSPAQLEVLTKEEDPALLFTKIPVSAIEELDFTGATFIAYLTEEQRKQITSKQIALIKDLKDLELLEPASWQHATEEVLQGMPVENIQSIPAKHITPLLLGKLSEKQIQHLTEPQVQRIEDPNLSPHLTQSQVSWFNEDQYKRLRNKDLLEKVPAEKLVHINPIMTSELGSDPSRLRSLIVSGKAYCTHFAHLSREQLEVLSKEEDAAALFAKIPLEGIKLLDLTSSTEKSQGFIPLLTIDQKKMLTERQIALIRNPTDLERLASASWQHANTDVLQALSKEKIPSILLDELTPLLLGKLSIEQLQSLTGDQVRSLEDPNMCLSLSEAQVGQLTPSQYQKLNNKWLIEKVPDEKLIYINPEMTKHIGLDRKRLTRIALDTPGKYTKHFGYLTRGQLDLLLPKENSRVQNPGPEENLALKITPTDIPRLPLTETPCLVKHLSQEHLGHLTSEQIQRIEFLEDLLLLPGHLWQYGRQILLRQLTEDQIRKIPSQGITDRLLRALTQDQAENFSKKQITEIENPNECVRLPAAQLNWIPGSRLHLLTSANRQQIQRIMSVAHKRFDAPELPEIIPTKKDFRNIGSGFLPRSAQSTRNLWIELESKTAKLTSFRGNASSLSFYPFQARSEKEIETLWDKVFNHPGSIIIDLTTNPDSDRLSYYPTQDSPWWLDSKTKAAHYPQRNNRSTEEDWEPFRLSGEDDYEDIPEPDLTTQKEREISEACDIPGHTDSYKNEKRKLTVSKSKTDEVTKAVTYRIIKNGIFKSSEEDLLSHLALVNQRGGARFEFHSQEVQQYHCPKWPVDGIISVQNLHRLIENIQKIAAKTISQRKAFLESIAPANTFDLDNIKPIYWVRENEDADSADTVIAALALKEKFDLGEVKANNFDQVIEEIILSLRKEKGPQFLKKLENLDLLRRYANALITKPRITRVSDVDPMQSKLWDSLQEKTKSISQAGWRAQVIGDCYWPINTQEIVPTEALTAHRVGKGTCERYFVACKGPTKGDWNLFWRSVFEKDGTRIVDLTEDDSYALGLGVYYPQNKGQTVLYGDVKVTCEDINDKISTYQVTDTSADVETTKTIKRYHYKKWHDGAAITLTELQGLVKDVESLTLDPKKPLWIHCQMGVGRTGTLITALALKEKILKGQLTQENLEKELVDIIVGFRKERSIRFINAESQLGLLYQYARDLIKTCPVSPSSGAQGSPLEETRSSPSGVSAPTVVIGSKATADLVSIQTKLWEDLDIKTKEIPSSSRFIKYIPFERHWAYKTIINGKALTAHRIGENNSQHHFIACTAPTKADSALFWQSILKGTEARIVDLTENDKYAFGEEVYYPREVDEEIICGESIIVKCTSKCNRISTYEVVDASADEITTKIINRYHFRDWPDGKAITLPKLQELITEVESFAPNPQNPLWIHCFMGVGRTGTLMTAFFLKEAFQRGELTKANLEIKLVDIIFNCRNERANDFVTTPDQLALLHQYGNYLLEGASAPMSSGNLQTRSPAGVAAASTLPADFISERGAEGDCAPLSLLHQLQQRGIKKPDGSNYTSQQEVRKIGSDYLREHIDQLAAADITENTTPDALLMTAVVGSMLDTLMRQPDHILRAQRYNSNALLTFDQKKEILTNYAALIDQDGFWLDKGFFQLLSAALGRQIVILRPQPSSSLDLFIHERFPDGAINPKEALFIYYNGVVTRGGNHYQSIQLQYLEKLTSLTEKDLQDSLDDFIKEMRIQKEKQDRIPRESEAKARELAEEIRGAALRNLADLPARNPYAYEAILTLLQEGLGRAIRLEHPLPDDVINRILSLTNDEIQTKVASQRT